MSRATFAWQISFMIHPREVKVAPLDLLFNFLLIEGTANRRPGVPLTGKEC